jgi:hypothetical protein
MHEVTAPMTVGHGYTNDYGPMTFTLLAISLGKTDNEP